MGGHFVFLIFILILAFLALSNYTQTNGLIGTGANSINTYTRTLQGRS